MARAKWLATARPNQITPPGDWAAWLLCAGRGYGKSRTGAEDAADFAMWNDGVRVAVVAPTFGDGRDICFEGDSGLCSVIPRACVARWNRSIGEMILWNGSRLDIYSADEPERLRGPQHHRAWCLAGDTRILMADGSEKPIRDVHAGDMVMTRQGGRRVTGACMTSPSADVLRLETNCGRIVLGTTNHNFFFPDGRLVPFGALRPGDRLNLGSLAGGALSMTAVTISSVARCRKQEAVYDLTVEGAHEFFANGLLVHNCDEVAAWCSKSGKKAGVAQRYVMDMLDMGLRLGANPQKVITTTPKPVPVIRDYMRRVGKDVVLSTGSTFDNAANLAKPFLDRVLTRYQGTRLGRQELYAELLEDFEGALWTYTMLEETRVDAHPHLIRIVVAVDPSGAGNVNSTSDEIGIIVAGLGVDGHGYLLEDCTLTDGPAGWARAAVSAYRRWGADRIVAESNFGGAMVEATIRTADKNVPVRMVTASRGKTVRAEPISALYEQGKVHHVGYFQQLEDQMVGFTKVGYQGDGSPDRGDAAVWALTELMVDGVAMPMAEAVSIPRVGFLTGMQPQGSEISFTV